MTYKRVFILAIDGLEYDFVLRNQYSHLLQQYSYRLEIPRSWMTVMGKGHLTPYTYVIWRALLTGNLVNYPTHKQYDRWEVSALNYLRTLPILPKIYSFCIKKGRFQMGLPARLGFKYKNLGDSIFDLVPTSVIVHHPLAAMALDPNRSLNEYINYTYRLFRKERGLTWQKLDQIPDWDLFFCYTRLLDIAGHGYWQNDPVMRKYYHQLDYFATELQLAFAADTLFLVVSDHGMRPLPGTDRQGGEHSHHAFLSCNQDLALPPAPTIEVVYPVLCKLLSNIGGHNGG